MKIILVVLFLLFYQNFCIVKLSEVLSNLKILENYIKEFKIENKNKESLTHIVTSYIRKARYKDVFWTYAAGDSPKDLNDYIIKKDKERGTKSKDCLKYGDILLPTNEKIDFIHLFATINGIEYSNSFQKGTSALVGWGGDLSQLIQDIKNKNGDLNKLYIEANKLFGISGQFGEADLIADLEAPFFLSKKNDNNTFAEIIEKYYNEHQYKNRVRNFVKLTFPTLTDKSDKKEFRKVILQRYMNDTYLKVLELKYAIFKGYENHRLAAAYTFSDYLKKNY